MTYTDPQKQATITIDKNEVRTTTSGKSYGLITDVNGELYSVWDSSIELQPKKTYAIFYTEQTKGDRTYKTIKSAQESKSQGATAQSKDDVWTKKDQLSARQTSINCASNIVAAQCQAGKDFNDVTKEILRIGRELYQYVYYGDEDWNNEDTENMIEDVPFN